MPKTQPIPKVRVLLLIHLKQARNALKVFQEIVAEDYAQFMSEQTGIHADYFRFKC